MEQFSDNRLLEKFVRLFDHFDRVISFRVRATYIGAYPDHVFAVFIVGKYADKPGNEFLVPLERSRSVKRLTLLSTSIAGKCLFWAKVRSSTMWPSRMERRVSATGSSISSPSTSTV